MKQLIISIFAVMCMSVSISAQGQDKDFTKVFGVYEDEFAQRVIGHMADKKFNGREAGTKENRKIMKFIAKEFDKIGLDVQIQRITDETLTKAIGAHKKGKAYPKEMANVIATIPGVEADKYVVVGAHYDHLGNKVGIGIHPGADDNASGIVALLSLAKMMKAQGITPKYTILFCAWDGEEKGLLGSKYFVADWFKDEANAKEICYYMNFDMVGRTQYPEHPAVTFSWNDNYPQLKEEFQKILDTVEQPFKILYEQRFGDGKGGSDYAPFSLRNIPFVAWMEDQMHEDYHKPGDTPDKIHWEKLRKTVLLSYGVLYGWVK